MVSQMHASSMIYIYYLTFFSPLVVEEQQEEEIPRNDQSDCLHRSNMTVRSTHTLQSYASPPHHHGDHCVLFVMHSDSHDEKNTSNLISSLKSILSSACSFRYPKTKHS